jgi:hypothetical protein
MLLRLRLNGSRLELAILLVCYGLAQQGMVRSGLSLPFILLSSGILVVFTLYLASQALRLPENAVTGVDLTEQGRAILYTDAGGVNARLSRIVYSNYWLTVLDFRVTSLPPGQERWPTATAIKTPALRLRLCIAPDSVSRQARKELVVFLRCFVCLQG